MTQPGPEGQPPTVVTAAGGPQARHPEADWWRQAVVYQIYPRSFADATGDGIGDLPGITSRVPHLRELGVDAVWLSPFYPSALADGGYDVDDYRDVDPRLGTLADFDEMTAALHGAGIRLIVDIVPNHTSDRHRWFQEALASPKGSPARERYIFRDGLGEDGATPPSDWESLFGGSAWERVPEPDGSPGQWYLHLFAREQPDLNWDSDEVRQDFLHTIRFWADRGVDGFRVDVAHALTKDMTDPLPSTAELSARELGTEGEPRFGEHPFWDRDEVHEIYVEWRKVFDEYDPPRMGVAEAWVHSARRPRYASPSGLGQAFNFDLLQADPDADQFRRVVDRNLAEAQATDGSLTWVLSNHDVVRHPTRYGLARTPGEAAGLPDATSSAAMERSRVWVLSDGREPPLDREAGLRRARAATLLVLALPGSAYLYQGEELGLHEVVEIPDEARQDPTFFRNAGVDKGRDGCRVPLPWTADGSSFGFGDDGAHLPQPAWFRESAADVQAGDPASTLSLYRRALAERRRLQTGESLRWDETAAGVLCFTRPGGWTCITNFGTRAVPLPAGRLVMTSSPTDPGVLAPDTTAWLVPDQP